MRLVIPFVFTATAFWPLSSSAQDAAGDREALAALRACASEADLAARLACYDDRVGVEVAVADPLKRAARAPTPATPSQPRGFGAGQLAMARTKQDGGGALTTRLAKVSQSTPGIYLLTLPDGAQWQFVEAVPLSYNPPREGSSVEFLAAALGSYLLRYDRQPSVRVKRVR